MRLHLFNARRLSDELAAGTVAPREQALYLAVSFVAWLVPNYSGIYASPAASSGPFADGIYWTEFAMMVLINFVGALHCLRNCHVAPERHFLVDFTCLSAPVTVVVLTVTWAAFHAAIWVLPRALSGVHDFKTADYVALRTYDVLRYLTVVGQVFLVYAVVGHYMRRAASLRA